MAKIEVQKAKVETKVVEVEPAKVNVELTMEEANALLALLRTTRSGGPLHSLNRSLVGGGVGLGGFRARAYDARLMQTVNMPRIEILRTGGSYAGSGKYGDEEW